MMCFVTLHPGLVPWFEQFVQALLYNSVDVIGLLKSNPFPNVPPNVIRGEAWRYTFTIGRMTRLIKWFLYCSQRPVLTVSANPIAACIFCFIQRCVCPREYIPEGAFRRAFPHHAADATADSQVYNIIAIDYR